ncbi:colicin V production protein [Motilibacter rhizosphaerae]|uniref:Colicin V production protein n=1 Tax=Motilibacter rhizosphaerae TaxID=598652 RepID=A0A4Q7NX68_9ACTN|nr:MarP family serine protease [Motilibacter rhizosphaerae]RZS91807.1 colicin V production protein [Motilibacter rhizosphaerae]
MIVDVVLAVAAVSFALSGWRQGALVGAFGFAGFLAGGVGAMIATPKVVDRWSQGPLQVLVAAGIVLVAALLGQALLTALARRLRSVLVRGPLRWLDAGLGAALSVLGLVTISWFLATAARTSTVPEVSRQVSESRVLRAVDEVMPDASRSLFASFRGLLDEGQFPEVFGGLAPERILPVSPPDDDIVSTPAVARAAGSIVQVVGSAPSCDRRIEGSGFVYAEHHVLTNAHVVAGVRQPTVMIGGRGEAYPGTVVAFDARRDVAVIYVPGLPARARPLPLVAGAGRGDASVVAGFPRGGPYRLSAARVREQIRARGPDIYGKRQTTRDVLSLYATVQPGNSGGPLLTPKGGVAGVVFAKSVDDPKTGYALTVSEVSPVADRARALTTAVPTGACAD